MKILFLTNNYPITESLYDWLKLEAKEDVMLYSDKLTIDFLKENKVNMIISYNYRYIITEDILEHIQNRAINLHISLLPWNRGAHPNLWSFLEDTPKGVTIHLIDKGIDTGDILLQKELYFDENIETLETSYNKLYREIQNLFIENWQRIKSFAITPVKQEGKGSLHSVKDFERIKSLLGGNIFTQPISIIKQRDREKINVYSG